MKRKKTIAIMVERLQKLRYYFQIDFIYFNQDNEFGHQIEIKPNDNSLDLDFHFSEIVNQYEKELQTIKKKKIDVPSMYNEIKKEIEIIDEIIKLQNGKEVISYFNPIYYDVDTSGNIKPPSNLNYRFSDEEEIYIWNHYIFRRKYFRKILSILKSALAELKSILNSLKIIKPQNINRLDKILSEFWCLLEVEIFKSSIGEKELSLIRHQLFTLLSIDDFKYSKHKSEILSRKENNRFSDLSKLINKGTIKLISVDSRSVQRLRKNKQKAK